MQTTVMPWRLRTWASPRERPTISLGGFSSTSAKPSSSWTNSIIRPVTRWATRRPMSCSGKTTWWAPTRSRMRPWGTVIALAQMSGTSRPASTEVVRMLASRSVPMPTTARPNSPAPSWRMASSSVASASTTWVRTSALRCTLPGSASTPSTWWPRSIRVSARAVPNRPSPTTSTPSSGTLLANDRSFLRVAVAGLALAQGERGGQCNRAGAAEEHEQDEQVLGRQGKLGGDPGGQPDRPEGRKRLEQGLRHRQPAEGLRQGLALGGAGDAPAEGVDRGQPPRLGRDHQDEHGEGGHPDAAAGAGAAGPDEHQDVGDQPRGFPHGPVVDRVEPGRPRAGAVEDGGQQLAGHVERTEGGRIGPLQ